MKNLKINMLQKYYKCEGVIKKYSPEILAAVGVVGIVTSAVMACKATVKLNSVLSEGKEVLDKITDTMDKIESGELGPEYKELYTPDDAKKDRFITYTQTGIKVAKLYLPSVILGSISIGCMLSSNNILRKRNMALSAAYLTIDKSFKEYRNRVSERFGDEVERDIRFNVVSKEVEVMDENGETVTKTIEVANPNGYSDYARFFDESSPSWNRIPEYNLMFLKSQQQFANDILMTKGRLFLNDVYEMLGIEKTKAGQVVGWVYDLERPTGDNYVDFGIYDMDKERARAFVNGYESNILLDFNVDGNIWDLM